MNRYLYRGMALMLGVALGLGGCATEVDEPDVGTEEDVSRASSPITAAHWGEYEQDGCLGANSKQVSAILWDIPWGESWEYACWSTPSDEYGLPHRCVKNWYMWGQWDVPDEFCPP